MAPHPRHSTSNTTSSLSGPARSIQISKSLSWLLRHGATKERVPITPDGYVKLSDVLAWHKLKAMHVGVEEVVEVVKSNEKQRFGLRWDGEENGATLGEENGNGVDNEDASVMNGEHEDDGLVLSTSRNGAAEASPPNTPTAPPTSIPSAHTIALSHLLNPPFPPASLFSIRAVQGHSLKSISGPSLLTPLTPTSVPSTVVHGTFFRAWVDILASGGLKAMGRNHIHFATGPVKETVLKQEVRLKEAMREETVVSGMRGDAEVLIYVDVKRAMEAGVQWFVSENGVVLTEGLVEIDELRETEMMLADGGIGKEGEGEGTNGDGEHIGQNGSTMVKKNHSRRNSRQVEISVPKNASPQKMVPMAYWDVVIGIGVGVLWEQGKGVVQEVPVKMIGRGKRGGRGGGGDRGGRGGGHTRNRSSVNPKPMMKVERDDMDGFD